MDRQHRALGIVNPQFGAVAVPEAEFIQVALEVLLAAVLVNPDHAALEDAEGSLDGVGCHVAAGVLLGAVVGQRGGAPRRPAARRSGRTPDANGAGADAAALSVRRPDAIPYHF